VRGGERDNAIFNMAIPVIEGTQEEPLTVIKMFVVRGSGK
jgi:hypothetical protein